MVNSSSSDEVTGATIQADGKIVIGGDFTKVSGVMGLCSTGHR